MHQPHLKPADRDLFLTVVDLLIGGDTTLRARVIAGGQAVFVQDVLFAASASVDKLPSLTAEALRALYQVADAPTSYGAAARLMLTSHREVELRRAEQAEIEALARWEGEVEARRMRAAEKKAAEEAKAKEQRRALKAKRSKAAPARAAA
jgi:regulator of protease activity HflC (stomatin/prohibitin superfamily)